MKKFFCFLALLMLITLPSLYSVSSAKVSDTEPGENNLTLKLTLAIILIFAAIALILGVPQLFLILIILDLIIVAFWIADTIIKYFA